MQLIFFHVVPLAIDLKSLVSICAGIKTGKSSFQLASVLSTQEAGSLALCRLQQEWQGAEISCLFDLCAVDVA